jgi:hypothetical protein
MSTGAAIRVLQNGETLVCIVQHGDGMPESLGIGLAKFLAPLRVVNGLPMDRTNIVNGIECLAATIIKELKDGPGGIYIYPHNYNLMNEDYLYEVSINTENQIVMSCFVVGMKDGLEPVVLNVPPAQFETAYESYCSQ